jgi:predicted DNA-binding transcriptional regulator AlpA
VDELLDVLVERISDAVAEKIIAGVIEAMAPPATPWKLLDVHEVAALLGRSRRSVDDYVKYQGLPTIRLDRGSLRFDPRDVADWCRSRRIPAADPSEPDCRTIARPLSIPSRRANRIPNPTRTGGGGR